MNEKTTNLIIKAKDCLKSWSQKLSKNNGIGTIEVILILVVLIALIVIFRTQLTEIINAIFQRISNEASNI